MTWFEQIEQKRTLLVGGIITICLTALAVTARRKPVAFDSYWHLQTGLDWLHRGLSPWVDHFSFTHAGEAIRSQPFVFQAALAWLVDTLGLEAGFQAYKLASFLLALGLVTLFLKRLRSPAIIYLMVLPLFVLLLELRSTVRPELIGYSFSIVAVMLYHRAGGEISTRNMLPIALLLLVWTNYHSSILGYIVYFGFFIDAAVRQFKQRSGFEIWIKWLFWGGLVLAAGFLNKGFSHPVINAFFFDPEWKDFIQEYQPATVYKGVKGIYALIMLVIATAALALWKQRFGYLIVTLVFTYISLQMVRLVVPCGIIVLCFFVSLASEIDFRQTTQQQGAWGRRFSVLFVLSVGLASLFSSVVQARNFMEENKVSEMIRPELMVDYIKERQLSGRIFNEFGIGGYLIYALSPDSRVYIDGRTNILYPLDHYKRFLESLDNPEILKEEIDKYDINLAIVWTDQRSYTVMQEAGALALDFVDAKYSLFTRDSPRFPLTGKLLGTPACWNDSDAAELEAEYSDAIWSLPTNSSLIPILAMMFNYSKEPDKKGFLREFEASSAEETDQLRFAAYRALSLDLFEVSVNLFERIPIWDHREFLSAATANLELGKFQEAEQIIDTMTMGDWPYIAANDLMLLYRILETIRDNIPLQHVADSYVDDLKKEIESMHESTQSRDLDLQLLCAI